MFPPPRFCHISTKISLLWRSKYAKIRFPRWGAHDAPPDPLVGWRGNTPPHMPPHSTRTHLRRSPCVPPEVRPDLRLCTMRSGYLITSCWSSSTASTLTPTAPFSDGERLVQIWCCYHEKVVTRIRWILLINVSQTKPTYSSCEFACRLLSFAPTHTECFSCHHTEESQAASLAIRLGVGLRPVQSAYFRTSLGRDIALCAVLYLQYLLLPI